MVWNKAGVTYFFNGNPTQDVSPRYSVNYTASGLNDLKISSVALDDDAFYTCQVFGFDMVQVKLNVHSKYTTMAHYGLILKLLLY